MEYKIYNPRGPDMNQEMLTAIEMSGCCQRQYCQNRRAFEMTVNVPDGKEVCRFSRPFKFFRGGCCGTCSGNGCV